MPVALTIFRQMGLAPVAGAKLLSINIFQY